MPTNVPLDRLGKVLSEDLRVTSEQDFKLLVFDLYSEIVSRTPVDTGRAKSNWNISKDFPDFSTDVQSSNLEIDVTGYPNVYISNGLPYISALEDGHSKQSPVGITVPALSAVRAKHRNRRRS